MGLGIRGHRLWVIGGTSSLDSDLGVIVMKSREPLGPKTERANCTSKEGTSGKGAKKRGGGKILKASGFETSLTGDLTRGLKVLKESFPTIKTKNTGGGDNLLLPEAVISSQFSSEE